MKHVLCFTLLLTFSFALNAQEKKLTWDYPVKPGMEEWSQFKSINEMYEACQVPDNILKQIDTESLVDLCLSFPAPPVFPLFNTPQEAFLVYFSNFNGIRELFDRKDAGQYLLKKYTTMSLSDFNPSWPLYKQGQYISHYKFVEAILSQPQVIASMDVGERKDLLREAILKLDEKKSKNDIFGDNSLEINLWIIGKILYSDAKSFFQRYNQQSIQTAIESGLILEMDIDALYQQANKYVNESK
jgi:hypothetical protein